MRQPLRLPAQCRCCERPRGRPSDSYLTSAFHAGVPGRRRRFRARMALRPRGRLRRPRRSAAPEGRLRRNRRDVPTPLHDARPPRPAAQARAGNSGAQFSPLRRHAHLWHQLLILPRRAYLPRRIDEAIGRYLDESDVCCRMLDNRPSRSGRLPAPCTTAAYELPGGEIGCMEILEYEM